jgi:2-oxoglutarate ferredoxin oxidoreductase subunit delta
MNVKVVMIQDRCKGCGICVAVCQTEVLELSEDENSRGIHIPVVVHPDKCLNCGLCEMFCPDFAIWATSNLDEAVS